MAKAVLPPTAALPPPPPPPPPATDTPSAAADQPPGTKSSLNKPLPISSLWTNRRAHQTHHHQHQLSSSCVTNADCRLAGACVNGVCACDPGFTGTQCQMLDLVPAGGGGVNKTKRVVSWSSSSSSRSPLPGLLPSPQNTPTLAPVSAAQALYASNSSSWGGSVIQDPVSGRFYMYVAAFANGCGLDSWTCNSACVIAESDTVQGPFKITATALGPFCHNPTVHVAPDGTIVLFHIGSGTYHDGIKPMVCHTCNGSTGVPSSQICMKKENKTKKNLSNNGTATAAPSNNNIAVGKGSSSSSSSSSRLSISSKSINFDKDYFHAGQFRVGDDPGPPNIAYSRNGAYHGPFTRLNGSGGGGGWGANNPAAVIDPVDGSVLLVAKFACNKTVSPDPTTFCRQFGVFTAPSWNGTYTFRRMIEVFGEDPYLWRSTHGWHMIADLSQYTKVLPAFKPGTYNPRHAFSPNGLDWFIDTENSALPTREIPLVNGSVMTLTRRERPQILFAAKAAAGKEEVKGEEPRREGGGEISKGKEGGSSARPLAIYNGAALGETHVQGGDHTFTSVQPFRFKSATSAAGNTTTTARDVQDALLPGTAMEAIAATVEKVVDGRGRVRGKVQLKPYNLSVEYQAYTLQFVGTLKPRFSWKLQAEAEFTGAVINGDSSSKLVPRGLTQIAYQLRVWDAESNTSVWDTGRVESHETLHIEYNGTLLNSDKRYGWSVDVWAATMPVKIGQISTTTITASGRGIDRNGISDGSASRSLVVSSTPQQSEATFGTALLSPDDWGTNGTAPWLTSQHDGDNQYRVQFNLPSNIRVTRATAYWAGLGYGVLFVNGQRVAPEEHLGPWTTWSKRVLYRCHDVSTLLTAGENVLGVWLGQGQYRSKWTHAWYRKGSNPPLGLVFRLVVHGADGSTRVLDSDGSTGWTTSKSPVIADDVYSGETFDARIYDTNWAKPGYNATGDARAVPWDVIRTFGSQPRLSAHTFTPIRKVAHEWPTDMTEPVPGVFLFRFASNLAGVTALHNLRGPPGVRITLSHAEQLALPNGTVCLVDCSNGGNAAASGARAYYPFGGAVDTYVMRGSDGHGGQNESWDGALFSYHGFNFVEVSGWPVATSGQPTLQSISRFVVHSDNRRVTTGARFSTTKTTTTASSTVAASAVTVTKATTTNSVAVVQGSYIVSRLAPRVGILNTIGDNVVRTLLSNMHSVESDCPTRERVGWTGDAQATAETAVLNLDMASFYTKWLQDMGDALQSDGGLSSTVPFAKHAPPVDPSWPTAYLQIAMLLYQYYGDERVLATHYQNMQRYVNYVANVSNCPACHNPNGETQTQGLPDFYMNGDWMEYRAQADELGLSGRPMASFHYILDVGLLAQMADILGRISDAKAYSLKHASLVNLYNRVYLRVNGGGNNGTTQTCDYSGEIGHDGHGHTIELRCPGGSNISAIEFAAFGTPTGSCDTKFTQGVCNSKTASSVVAHLCLGQESCRIEPTSQQFGGDPCTGTKKHLAVRVKCDSRPPSPPPSPPPVTTVSYGPGQTINAVPLASGLVPSNATDNVISALVAEIVAAGNHSTAGFIGSKYIWEALSRNGHGHLALQLATSQSIPSYGYQIAEGATSIWENWSGAPDETNGKAPPSHNHHFMGGIGQWLVKNLAGLQIDINSSDIASGVRSGGGWARAVCAPEITDSHLLDHASVHLETIRGPVSCAWDRSRNVKDGVEVLRINASFAPNQQGTVALPIKLRLDGSAAATTANTSVSVSESGVLLWKDGHFVVTDHVPAVSVVGGIISASYDIHSNIARFVVGSGDYNFVVNVAYI